jgi:hypothetical protein
MQPARVKKSDEERLWNRQFAAQKEGKTSNPVLLLQQGDMVRLSLANSPFRKSYKGNWTREVFWIDSISTHHQLPMYVIRDGEGEVLKGMFYAEQLQKISRPE